VKPGSAGVLVAQVVMAIVLGLFPVAVWAFGINGASASQSAGVIKGWLSPWVFGVVGGIALLLFLAARGALSIPTDSAEMDRVKSRVMGMRQTMAAVIVPVSLITAAVFGSDIRISIASFGFGLMAALIPYQVYAAWLQYRGTHGSS
jgi:hypothetical protein